MDFRVILILIAEALFAFLLLLRAGVLKSRRAVLVSVLLIAAAFTVRGLCLDYMTLDYKDFLSKWVDFYRQNGGFKALHYPLGNYNIPYLYFLCLFSYSSINDLYLIKLLSIFFDVLLAYGAMMLLGKVKESIPARIACFFTVLFLPTVILNGSLWLSATASMSRSPCLRYILHLTTGRSCQYCSSRCPSVSSFRRCSCSRSWLFCG